MPMFGQTILTLPFFRLHSTNLITDEYLSTIKSIFNMVFEYTVEWVDFNQWLTLLSRKDQKPVRTSRNGKQVLEREEAEKLIEELYRRPSTYRLARLAEFMFLTGMW